MLSSLKLFYVLVQWENPLLHSKLYFMCLKVAAVTRLMVF